MATQKTNLSVTELKNVGITRSDDNHIILPAKMSYNEGIKWLQMRRDEEETEFNMSETFDCFPLEGALALTKAIVNLYGFSQSTPTPGMFGPRPPQMIAVPTAEGEQMAIWGRLEIPGLRGVLSTGLEVIDSVRYGLGVYANTIKRHEADFKVIMAEVRRILRDESIYRGRVLEVTFPDINDDGFDPLKHTPKVKDVSKAERSQLIFPNETGMLVDVTLFAPLEFPEACREAGIPLKRGVLLEGPYGCGKTLTQYVAAKLATENGWTVIQIADPLKELAQAIEFARKYQPALILAEDIDRVEEGGRGYAMNQIMNTIDGIGSKDTEIMVVLTTNHVEKITPAMLRPGRLDSVIRVSPPDAKAVEKLIRMYGGNTLDPKADLTEVGRRLEGNIPAVVREVVERSKLSAIARTGKMSAITTDDLLVTTAGMLGHLRLLEEKATVDNRERVVAAREIAAAIKQAADPYGPIIASHDNDELVDPGVN